MSGELRTGMRIVRTIAELRLLLDPLAADPQATVGFVPTMGFLHEGHESLIREARKQDRVVVLSIFVNPLQFGPNEDFERYPRDEDNDVRRAEAAGADIVFIPDVAEMYPVWPLQTTVHAGEAATRYCGASRPGHFDGVATVVAKLFHIVRPHRAYFGLKDAQQVAIVEQMVADLNMPVRIVGCPTVREPDGLAKSSRNVYLNPQERSQAVVLSAVLDEAGRLLRAGRTAGQIERAAYALIAQMPLARIDYAAVAAYPSLQPLAAEATAAEAAQQQPDGRIIVLLAVRFGSTRLIDNRIFKLTEVGIHA